jgi:trk system potassium uptake protein TrkA
MRIIIVGAGTVGSHLAERLSLEGQDIVVIEGDEGRAADLQNSVDCLVIHGNGASASVLAEAGIDLAELLIAVTDSDAVNVLACQAAAEFNVPRKVARVEDALLRNGAKITGVDVMIDPGEALAKELLGLVRKGGVAEVVEFAGGDLVLLGGFIHEGAPLAGMTLAELREQQTDWNWLVTAVVRNGQTLVGRGDTRVEEDDHVLIMARREKAAEAQALMGVEEHASHKVFVLGATRLADLTAEKLTAAGISTVLVDADGERCRRLAARHERLVVVQGDPTDPKVLRSEGIEAADAVLALTGWDETNIVGCLVAKAYGVPLTVARFHRSDYVHLLAGTGIDTGVSARLAAASDILRFVRRGRIISVTTFQDSAAEAIQLEVSPDSAAVGRSLEDIDLPKSAIVGGVIRDGEAFVPRGDTVVSAGDRLIVVSLPDAIHKVEQLFG